MSFTDDIKKKIGFGINEQRTCSGCEYSRLEQPTDRPDQYRCTVAGKFEFEVDESDTCLEWEK